MSDVSPPIRSTGFQPVGAIGHLARVRAGKKRARCPLAPQPRWLCYKEGLAGARPANDLGRSPREEQTHE